MMTEPQDSSSNDTALTAAAAAVKCAFDEPHILAAITTVKDQLADFIEPDFGLLDELLRLQVLTRRQFADIHSKKTVYKQNDALLKLLTSEDQCVKFLEALQLTSQQHVVNFITQNGGQKRSVDQNYSIAYLWHMMTE